MIFVIFNPPLKKKQKKEDIMNEGETKYINNFIDFDELERNAPQFIVRSQLDPKKGDPYSAGTMANYDSRGEGPKDRVMIGNKAAYPRRAYFDFLRSKVRLVAASGRRVSGPAV